MMVKGYNDAGLRKALAIQRDHPNTEWLRLAGEIRKDAERAYATEYLSTMLLRLRLRNPVGA